MPSSNFSLSTLLSDTKAVFWVKTSECVRTKWSGVQVQTSVATISGIRTRKNAVHNKLLGYNVYKEEEKNVLLLRLIEK